jgi:hypothetical protein
VPLPGLEPTPDACVGLGCSDAKVLRFFGAPLKMLHAGPKSLPDDSGEGYTSIHIG